MKQMEVTILGQSYILACPEGGESALLSAVAQVDSEMSAIRDAGKVKARERMAVLAALNLAYQLADRPASSAAAKAAPTTAQKAQQHTQQHTSADDVQIDTLIARIDAAMGADGRLL
jgi:cell division protein ZapA